jgi:hypothetical protein
MLLLRENWEEKLFEGLYPVTSVQLFSYRALADITATADLFFIRTEMVFRGMKEIDFLNQTRADCAHIPCCFFKALKRKHAL